MNSNIVATPKRTVLRRKHVLWAINRENPSTGSTWAHAREKIQYNQVTNQEKSHKAVIFHLSGEKPRWMDWNENLQWCRPRGDNHGRQVQIWKISGILMSLGGQNSPFTTSTALPVKGAGTNFGRSGSSIAGITRFKRIALDTVNPENLIRIQYSTNYISSAPLVVYLQSTDGALHSQFSLLFNSGGQKYV